MHKMYVKRKDKAIVVTRWKLDVEWVNEFVDEYDIIIYNKFDDDMTEDQKLGKDMPYLHESCQIFPISNARSGRDLHTQFHYCYHNYDDPHELVLFIQDNPHTNYGGAVDLDQFHNLKKPYEFIGLGPLISCDKYGAPHAPISYDMESLWDSLFEDECPDIFWYYAGDQIAVTKQDIHRRSKNFYKFIIDTYLLVNPVSVPICDPQDIWIFERILTAIFCDNYKEKTHDNK